MPISKLRGRFAACVATCFGLLVMHSTAFGTASLSEIVLAVERQEAYQNLAVEKFTLTSSYLAPGSSDWANEAFAIRGSAWFNGMPNGKARINIDSRITNWVDGPAKHAETSEDLAYDGLYGRAALHRSGAQGQTRSDMSGLMLPAAPEMLRDRFHAYATGIPFTLNYRKAVGRPSLSELIRAAEAKGQAPNISDDRQMVRLDFGDPFATGQSYWLDPSKNYALVRYESHRLSKGNFIAQDADVVDKFIEAAPGIWYPVTAYHEENDLERPGRLRVTYRAEKAVVNDPRFSDDVFTLVFPPNYRVFDRVRGIEYMSGPGPKQIDRMVDQAVREAQAAIAKPPSVASTMNVPSQGRARLWVAGGVLLLVVIGIVAFLRKMLSSRSALLLLLAGTPLSMTNDVQADGPPVSAEKAGEGHQYYDNCGVNISNFILQWFGRSRDVTQVAEELGAGKSFENRVSFADLKRVLDSSSLSVEAIKGDSIEDIVGSLKANDVACVRLKRMVNNIDVGHFVAVIESKGDYVLVDLQRPPVKLSRADAVADPLLKTTTGEALLVRLAGTQDSGLFIRKCQYDLGVLPINSLTIEQRVEIENRGSKALHVSTKVGCGACTTIDVPQVLSPHSTVTMIVRFDKSRIGAGTTEKTVLVECDDPKSPKTMLTFKMDNGQSYRDDRPFILPAAVEYGRIVQLDSLRPVTFEFYEDGKQVTNPLAVEAGSEYFSVTPVEALERPVDGLDGRPVEIRRYTLSWRKLPPAGVFKSTVTFREIRVGKPSFEAHIPITVDVRSPKS